MVTYNCLYSLHLNFGGLTIMPVFTSPLFLTLIKRIQHLYNYDNHQGLTWNNTHNFTLPINQRWTKTMVIKWHKKSMQLKFWEIYGFVKYNPSASLYTMIQCNVLVIKCKLTKKINELTFILHHMYRVTCWDFCLYLSHAKS